MAGCVTCAAGVPSEDTAVQGTPPPKRSAGDVDTRWSIAVAASFIAFFTVASSSNLGFFYVCFLEEFQTTRQQASWPGSVLQIMGHVSGILVAIIQPFFSMFHIAFVGSILLWLGLLAAVFAPNIPWMTVTFGFVHGAAMGVVSVAVIVSLMTHFEKYRGVACGFKYTGNTLASLLLPKLLSWLQDLFDFRGTLLIYAALIMNATAFTLFFRDREPSGIRKARHISDANKLSEDAPAIRRPAVNGESNHVDNWENGSALDSGSDQIRTVASSLNKRAVYPRDYSPEKVETPALVTREPTMVSTRRVDADLQAGDVKRTRRLSEKLNFLFRKRRTVITNNAGLADVISESPLKKSGSGRRVSVPNFEKGSQCNRIDFKRNSSLEQGYGAINGASSIETTGNRKVEDHSAVPRTCHCGTVKILLKPTFYLLVLGAVASDYTMLVVHATIVDYALDKGVQRKSAELSMTYCATTELMGRLLLPLVADFNIVGRTTLVALCFSAMAVTSAALPFTSSFVTYIIVQVTTALFLACVATLKGVLVADNFGAKAVPTFWGANGLALIPLLSANPFITGYFRDTMGSYDNLLRLLAGIQLFTAAVFFALAYVQNRRRRMNS